MSSLLNGLYKVEYGVNDAFGRSIMCMHNGRLLGGDADAGAEREEVKEESLHEAPHSFRAGRAVRHCKARRQRE